ncbi:MAG: prolipoprotein diacylglyceryl transferase family protein [Bacillota bacterium]
MFDIHYVPSNWGIIPRIFGVSSYTFFVGLGILAALVFYFVDARRRKVSGEGAILIVTAALMFGILGSKAPLLIANHDFLGRPDVWFEGKTIVGGFLGGMAGVILVKKVFRLKMKLGNIIAPAVALGMAIGRLGCFFNGCCYGKPSPIGFNFGDGVTRMPTQLIDSVFNLISFFVLLYLKDRVIMPGILFKYYISAYLVFRFFIEFLRENQILILGLTLYQVLCILGLILVNYKLIYILKPKVETGG